MAATTFQPEDRIGLLGSLAAHAVLVLVLVVGLPFMRVPPPPERITVTISDEVGLKSTSPDPTARAAPDEGPEIGEAPAPVPEVVPSPTPTPAPRVIPTPVPRPTAAPHPRPSPSPRAVASPHPPQPRTDNRTPPRQPGSSRFADAFRQGVPGAQQNGNARTPQAAQIGPQVVSALSGAISRQIKPHWVAPQGVDVDRLVTILAWDLNPDGTLAGRPRVVSQTGITEANRPQAARHAEQAVRAVQLAAPFALPPQYYDAWKRVSAFRFDRRLSQ